MFSATKASFDFLTKDFSFPAVQDISPKAIFFNMYNDSAPSMIQHTDVRLIDCTSRQFSNHMRSFSPTHFVFCVSCLGEIPTLFLLLLIMESEIQCVLIPHIIYKLVNTNVLVLPESICLHTCTPVASVLNGNLQNDCVKPKIFRISRDELLKHNEDFRYLSNPLSQNYIFITHNSDMLYTTILC
jgi:hypothetical protein